MNDAQIPTEELKGKPRPHPHWYIWIELGQNSFKMPLSLLPRLPARPQRPLWHHRWRMADLCDAQRCHGKVKAEGRNQVEERHKGSLFRTSRLKRKLRRKQWLGWVTSSKSDSAPGLYVKLLLFVWSFIATNSGKIWSRFSVRSVYWSSWAECQSWHGGPLSS